MKKQNPIFLSTWSIRDQIESRNFSLNQLPQFAEENGFQGVEIVDRHFPSLEANVIKLLIQDFRKSGTEVSFALSNDFTLEEPEALQDQIEYVNKMILIGSEFNIKTIRIYIGGLDNIFQKILKQILSKNKKQSVFESIKRQKSFASKLVRWKVIRNLYVFLVKQQKPKRLTNPKIKDRIFRALDRVMPIAEKKSITLAIENHWGVTTLAENILDIIDYYSSPYLGSCPDFGNFTYHQDRYTELEKLMAYAKEVHAKSYKFHTNGEEIDIDYEKCFSLIKSTGFSGPITVEYEGEGEQIRYSLITRDLILKYI